VRAVNEHHERLGRIEAELLEQAKAWRFYPVVEALQALRAVQFIHYGYQHRRRLVAKGKNPNVVVVAIARKLAGRSPEQFPSRPRRTKRSAPIYSTLVRL